MTQTLSLTTLKKRAQFIALRLRSDTTGDKIIAPAFILQYAIQPESSQVPTLHFGVTATKKVGNAVIRNRAKRRLREAMRLNLGKFELETDIQIVLIARHKVLDYDFAQLEADIQRAIRKINKQPQAA